MRLMSLLLITACGGKAPDPEPVVTAETDPVEAAAEPTVSSSHELDPKTVCNWSVCGTLTDEAGRPMKGMTMLVVRSDDVVEEPNPLEPAGFLYHIREENAGPPPWKLTFAAPGHVSQTVDVPGPPPEAGTRLEIKLVAE